MISLSSNYSPTLTPHLLDTPGPFCDVSYQKIFRFLNFLWSICYSMLYIICLNPICSVWYNIIALIRSVWPNLIFLIWPNPIYMDLIIILWYDMIWYDLIWSYLIQYYLLYSIWWTFLFSTWSNEIQSDHLLWSYISTILLGTSNFSSNKSPLGSILPYYSIQYNREGINIISKYVLLLSPLRSVGCLLQVILFFGGQKNRKKLPLEIHICGYHELAKNRNFTTECNL